MKKVLAYVLILLAIKAFAQTPGIIDGATSNLVYTTVNPPPPGVDPFTWSGFTNTDSNGGGLYGGSQPAYNPNTGTFMFGYNPGTIAYSTAVNYALSVAGTGIQVNGFKYSWEYLNQDYSKGTLTGNVNLTNTTGQILQNYSYTMPQTTSGWTRMSGIENFNTQYSASSIGSLNVSFTGKDDRWWAGYYGPQVRAIDVSLLYSVAPPPIPTDFAKWIKLTDENGEFTLTKAGVVRYGAQGTYIYQSLQAGTYSCSNSAWGRDPLGGVYKECDLGSNTTSTTVLPTTTTSTTTVVPDYTTGTALQEPTTTTTSTAAPSSTGTTTNDTPSNTNSSTSTTSTTPSTVTASPTIVSAPTSTTSSSSSSTSTTTSTSSSTPKESSGSSMGNVSLALSVIAKNQERDAAGSAIAQAAIAQAQAQANQAQQEATSIAANAVSSSTSSNAVGFTQQSSGTGIKVSAINTSSLNTSLNTTNSVLGGPQTALVNPTQQNTGFNSIVPPAVAQQEQQAQQQVIFQLTGSNNQNTETYLLVAPNFLTDRSNPLTDLIDSNKVNTFQNNTSVNNISSVNKSVQDSELATGISITNIASTPVGYTGYLNLVLKDVVFYAPKEVYRNQKTIDNARALRAMTNDSRHQELVNLQYIREDTK